MISRANQLLASTAFAIAVAGCASTPPTMQEISSSANPATEIERTEEMLKEARDQQVDVLSPENFTDASKELEKAKEKREKRKVE
ncbi:hypothetical protein [Bdellovibrio bacteriovorus]|uniref:hypothetical protein n=1 Tax=Bdellovibrio bacteriovorus TaxID=959 RepID=UPI0035A5AD08